jgi:hypothetical protein
MASVRVRATALLGVVVEQIIAMETPAMMMNGEMAARAFSLNSESVLGFL